MRTRPCTRVVIPAVTFSLACSLGGRSPQPPLPSPDQAFAAECVVAQARQEGFTTQRNPSTHTWVLARAYTGTEGVPREEAIYLRPLAPNYPDSVRLQTGAGTASPYLNAGNFAPALDRALRRIGAHCSPVTEG